MPQQPVTRIQLLRRWLGLTCATAGAAWVLRHYVASSAEVFWCLFPIWVLVGSWGLQLFPAPRLNAKSRAAGYAIIAILIAFPILFYGFLVYVTSSLWSWSELALCVYFFALSLECVLLIFFAAVSRLEERLKRVVKPRWQLISVVALKILAYGVLIPFMLVTFAVHRPKLIPRPLTAMEAALVETVHFPARDGLPLSGIFLPAPQAVGTVIVCHGVGANHADIKHLFLRLNSVGFQIVAFDFRGHGNSSGHTITYGLRERDDVLGAYDYCLTRKDITEKPLFALGVSMGGASLLQALPDMPQVQAAVVDSAFSNLERMAEHQLRFIPQPARSPMAQLVRGVAWIEIGADLRELAPMDRLREIHIPLLIVHGSGDTVVPVAHAHVLRAAAVGPVQLIIEPEAPHIGSVILDPTGYIQRVKQHFLTSISKPTKAAN